MNIMRFIIPKSLVEYIYIDSTVRQAVEKMRFHRYVAIPVIDSEGVYRGTLRNDDILKHFLEKGKTDLKEAENVGIDGIIDYAYCKPLAHSAPVEELFELVKEHNFVSVVDDRGCFIGIILRRDVMNYLIEKFGKTEKN